MNYLELARRLAEINKKMMKISEYTKMTDANRGEGVLLAYLRRHNGEATPTELSEALHVSTARIAVLLNKMERKQLVERQKHPNNNRNTIVKLLPNGRKLSEEQEEAFNQRVVSFFETLGEDKAALFVELQSDMVDFMLKHQT
ncbi:MAG: MarR family transcriptional regulator [Clostridiales bacterium]|nr:MarR family transcriptional regulator [Clostridiales bacterium]